MSSRANYYAKTLSVCPNGEMVTRSEKFVLMVLADAHQDGAHLRTYPRVATIAEDAMVSERQCQRIFASLERKGVLRREYPNGTGRDRLTFYIFPELDEQQGALLAVKKPAKQARLKPVNQPGIDADKGDKMSPLFEQEGCQKGDIRVTSGALHLNNKSNKSNKDKYTPLHPASGASDGVTVHPLLLDDAANEVMRACGWDDRRLRHSVRVQLRLASATGEALPLIAARMISAWGELLDAAADGMLRCAPYGPKKFIGLGMWNCKDAWPWDMQKLEMQRNARVGMRM